MPEVGMDMVEYFDPHSRGSMRDTLIKLITDPDLLRQKTEKIDLSRLRTWKQVSEELYDALEEDRQTQPAAKP
jgi:stalled ribosome alternative rescue factor ArfA